MSKPVIFAVLLAGCVLGGCSRSPQSREAKFLKAGKAQVEKKDYTRAILNFKNAVRAMPKEAEPYYQLGLAYLSTGDAKSAVACLRKAAELDPKHVGARLTLAKIMVNATDQRFVQEAAKRTEEVLALAPDNIEALDTLAVTELRLGKPDSAEKHLEEALRKTPDSLRSSIALARVKVRRRDVKGAEEVLKQAVGQAPHSADAAVVLGGFYAGTGRETEAEQQFEAALKQDPKNGPALLGLGAIAARAGRRDAAEQIYRRLSELPQKQYKPAYALFLFNSGKRDQAIAEFEKLARSDASDREARTRLVKAYLATNRVADAEKTLGEALKKNARDVDALVERARIYIARGRYSEAHADLNQVIGWRPDSAEAHYLLSRIHAARGDAGNRQQELSECLRLNGRYLPARIEMAQILIASNAARSALNILDEAPADQKRAAAVMLQRNWALMALGENAELRQGIDRILAVAKAPEALLQDAALKLEGKDFAGARTSLESILKDTPWDLRALNLLMRSYSLQRQPQEGLRRVREYAARAPQSASVQEFLGQLLAASGNRADARKAFAAAKAANPRFAPADLSLAELDMAEGRTDAARTSLTAIVASNPRYVPATLVLAGLEEKTGNRAAAMGYYRKALEVEQRSALALNNLAYLLAEANQSDEALKYAETAKEVAPESPAVDDTLGWIYYRRGIYVSAVKHLESAAEKEPTALRRYHLAMAYVKAGDYARGRQAFQAGLKLDASLPEAQEARKLLASLQQSGQNSGSR